MLRKRVSYIVFGTVLGTILTLSTGVLAETSKLVSAYLGTHIRFKFNGEVRKPSKDNPALIYKDSVYVPVRFITEGSNVPIVWNAQTQTIEITSPEPQIVEKIIYKEIEQVEKIEDEQKEEIIEKDNREYKTLPIEKTYNEMLITATAFVKYDNNTKFFFSVKNKQDVPLQVVQRSTKIFIDDKEYSIEGQSPISWDQQWYHDIRKDKTKEGFIIFNSIPEDAQNAHIVLTILINDSKGETIEVPFNIKIR